MPASSRINAVRLIHCRNNAERHVLYRRKGATSAPRSRAAHNLPLNAANHPAGGKSKMFHVKQWLRKSGARGEFRRYMPNFVIKRRATASMSTETNPRDPSCLPIRRCFCCDKWSARTRRQRKARQHYPDTSVTHRRLRTKIMHIVRRVWITFCRFAPFARRMPC